jgi:hypothetical protein
MSPHPFHKPRRIDFLPEVSEDCRSESALQIESCFGPHVGSYHNKVFKRFMYATKLPIVLFFDNDKVDCPVEAGKCHYILDSSFTWEQLITEHPVAFCIGCTDNVKMGHWTKPQLIKYFLERQFSIIDESAASSVGSFIARNQLFIERFEERCRIAPKE